MAEAEGVDDGDGEEFVYDLGEGVEGYLVVAAEEGDARFDGVAGFLEYFGDFVFHGGVLVDVGDDGFLLTDLDGGAEVDALYFYHVAFGDFLREGFYAVLEGLHFFFPGVGGDGSDVEGAFAEGFIFFEEVAEVASQFEPVGGEVVGEVEGDGDVLVELLEGGFADGAEGVFFVGGEVEAEEEEAGEDVDEDEGEDEVGRVVEQCAFHGGGC